MLFHYCPFLSYALCVCSLKQRMHIIAQREKWWCEHRSRWYVIAPLTQYLSFFRCLQSTSDMSDANNHDLKNAPVVLTGKVAVFRLMVRISSIYNETDLVCLKNGLLWSVCSLQRCPVQLVAAIISHKNAFFKGCTTRCFSDWFMGKIIKKCQVNAYAQFEFAGWWLDLTKQYVRVDTIQFSMKTETCIRQ